MLRGIEAIPSLTCVQLAEMIDDGSSEFVVIDVRDEDYKGGHVIGAINAPSEELEDDDVLEELIEKVCSGGTCTKVVFHCMKSQERGPTCARRFANRLAIYYDDEDTDRTLPTVYFLEGGFEAFAAAYKQDATLCEDMDMKMWG